MLSRVIASMLYYAHMITTILFDYYGVFVSDTSTVWLDSHGLTRSGHYQEIVEKYDRGLIGSAEFYGILSTLSGDSVTAIEAVFKQPHALNQSVLAILKQLSGKYTIALTSNGTAHSREVFKQHGVDTLFRDFFVSSEMGVAKPSSAFFQQVVTRLGIKPEQAMFIDDSLTNIESASSLGFHTIHFTTSTELVMRLGEHGIAIDENRT